MFLLERSLHLVADKCSLLLPRYFFSVFLCRLNKANCKKAVFVFRKSSQYAKNNINVVSYLQFVFDSSRESCKKEKIMKLRKGRAKLKKRKKENIIVTLLCEKNKPKLFSYIILYFIFYIHTNHQSIIISFMSRECVD